VQLNSGTCLSGVFTSKLRLLRLETGEGLFQVAHDPNWPLIVETGRVSIADVGTRFDVYRRDTVGTRVAVLDGAVQIFPRGSISRRNGTPLMAGQQIDIPNDTSAASLVRHITPHDVEQMTAWLDGYIQFDGQPLGAILAEFARYQRVTFITADPVILSVRMGGTFRTTDVDSFVGALKIQCIRGKYNETHQNVTLTRIAGCR
jgi:transmembrane sensor